MYVHPSVIQQEESESTRRSAEGGETYEQRRTAGRTVNESPRACPATGWGWETARGCASVCAGCRYSCKPGRREHHTQLSNMHVLCSLTNPSHSRRGHFPT